VKPTDLLGLLQEIHRDKLALYRRHEHVARLVASYEFNNAYQYVIGREAVHLTWLRTALEGAGGTPDESGPSPDLPGRVKTAAEATALLVADVNASADFLTRWRPRVETVTHARHRTMLDVVLGETEEQQRFFQLAVEGRADLLGRRPEYAGTGGGVGPDRWVG